MKKSWNFLKSPKFWVTLAISVLLAGTFYFTKNYYSNNVTTIIGEQVIQTGPGTGKECIASSPGSIGCSSMVEVK